jgi:hypothetical protein
VYFPVRTDELARVYDGRAVEIFSVCGFEEGDDDDRFDAF